MAVGARQSDIRIQFLIEAVALCCLGGLIGVLLSAGVIGLINALQKEVSVHMGLPVLLLAFAVSSVIGLLFGILPARRAARMNPVDALARE